MRLEWLGQSMSMSMRVCHQHLSVWLSKEFSAEGRTTEIPVVVIFRQASSSSSSQQLLEITRNRKCENGLCPGYMEEEQALL